MCLCLSLKVLRYECLIYRQEKKIRLILPATLILKKMYSCYYYLITISFYSLLI